jgi:enoyl-CoA hydratase
MESETIIYETKGPVGILTLNRPECLNAANTAMSRELKNFFSERLEDLETRVLLLTGAGRGFCAGLDMKESTADVPPGGYHPKRAYERQRYFSDLILLMRQIPQPIIGAINGPAAGAGFSFALACDIRYAAPEAKFSAAYINIGVGGADLGSSWLFPRAVGIANAARYLMTGDLFSAEEALRIGMVQGVFGKDKLMEEAMKLAQAMAGKSPLGLRLTKEALDRNTGCATLEDAIRLEDRNQAMCISQLTAFRGK